jgi:protein-disulfide isomerase
MLRSRWSSTATMNALTAGSHALAAGKYAAKMRADFLGGARSGVNGTPTFFINGERHNGTFEFDDLVAAIELRLHARAVL